MALTGRLVVGWGNMTFKVFIYEEEKLCLSVSDKAYCSNLERTDKMQIPNSPAIKVKQNVTAAKTGRRISLL